MPSRRSRWTIRSSDQKSFGNTEAMNGADTSAKGTGDTKPPSASTSDGQVSVAGAVAVNVELASAEAYIGDGLTITSGGVLTVKSAANVDGSASATGAAVSNATMIDPSTVDTTNNMIDLGSASTLKTGDGVTYYPGQGGTAIGGLESGTEYFVYVVSGGTIQLYDSKADAEAHGTTGLITLTSTGSTGQFFTGGGSTGTSVGAAIAVNYAQDTDLAYLGGSTFTVGGLDVEATTTAPDTFNADATSGAGGGKTGVAGSLAINIAITDAEADLGYAAGTAGDHGDRRRGRHPRGADQFGGHRHGDAGQWRRQRIQSRRRHFGGGGLRADRDAGADRRRGRSASNMLFEPLTSLRSTAEAAVATWVYRSSRGM